MAQVRFKDNGSQARVDTQVSVFQAWERVRVIAREFDAFRLVSSGTIVGTSYAGSSQRRGESSAVCRYAPAVRAIVKSTKRSTHRGESTTELVDYGLR